MKGAYSFTKLKYFFLSKTNGKSNFKLIFNV